MNISDKPTPWILLRTIDHSEKINCTFALMRLSKDWKEKTTKRVQYMLNAPEDPVFLHSCWMDGNVTYYQSDSPYKEYFDTEGFLAGKSWAFVELTTEERKVFEKPWHRANFRQIKIKRDGTAHFTAGYTDVNVLFETVPIFLPGILISEPAPGRTNS